MPRGLQVWWRSLCRWGTNWRAMPTHTTAYGSAQTANRPRFKPAPFPSFGAGVQATKLHWYLTLVNHSRRPRDLIGTLRDCVR
jgi:hypothetical protein